MQADRGIAALRQTGLRATELGPDGVLPARPEVFKL
jgi:hypothetical protein